MAKWYYQTGITITPEQQELIKANHSKMNRAALARLIGESYSKTVNNIRAMGLSKVKKARVIQMEGYFNEETFFKEYRY
jgi:hypothetical protein